MVLCLGFGTARKKTPWLEPSAELAAPGTPTASIAATQSWSAPASPLRLVWLSSGPRADGHKRRKGREGAAWHKGSGVA
jgi:hypothetical protein